MRLLRIGPLWLGLLRRGFASGCRAGGYGFGVGVGAHKVASVNRAPQWLLPTVLTALVLAVVAGALLK